jgi:prepilin-type N-terminal cleavage/methylation domain-containing protein
MTKLLKSDKGFTLIELLVAMAIIALLIGMTIFGVSQAFQSSVETQRQNLIREVQTGIVAYRGETGSMPENILFDSGGYGDIAPNPAFCISDDNNCDTTSPGSDDIVVASAFSNVNISDQENTETSYDNTQAEICYEPSGAGYALGVQENEDGDWFYITARVR